MKSLSLTFLVIVLLSLFSSSYAGDKWYENGNLHKKTIADWKNATDSNKLATSADMALASPKIKALVKKSGNVDTLKPYAFGLKTCIDKATVDKKTNKMKVTEVAAACIILMKWK